MLKVFLYLLLKARHNKKPKRYPDFDVKRGDLVTSLAEITEENQWYKQKAVRQWSRAKVARMLAKLKHDDRIEVIPDTYGTHVRICNYESYQDPQVYKADKTGQQRDNSETTVRLNNNGNNGNNDLKMRPLFQVFDHWNSYKGQTVHKLNDQGQSITISWHSHRLRADGSVPPDIEKAIRDNIPPYTVEDICLAISNYGKVVLGQDYRWTYISPLPTFLTVKYERQKGVDRKCWQFLPDNFVEEHYLTPEAKRKRSVKTQGPTVYELAKEQSQKQKEKIGESQIA